MENNRLDPTALEEEDLNWEKRLERLRQARQFNTAPTHAPLVKNRKRLSMSRLKPRLKKNINWMPTIAKKCCRSICTAGSWNTILPLPTMAKQWKPMQWWFCRIIG